MDDYSRFYKCDLQMQSPLSAHWRESESKLNMSDSLDRKREVAREYLKACHDAAIEIVGLTDHNFAPDSNSSFVQLLQSENEIVAKECGKPEIIISQVSKLRLTLGKAATLSACSHPMRLST